MPFYRCVTALFGKKLVCLSVFTAVKSVFVLLLCLVTKHLKKIVYHLDFKMATLCGLCAEFTVFLPMSFSSFYLNFLDFVGRNIKTNSLSNK